MTQLKTTLEAIRAGFEPKVPPEVLSVMHRANADLTDQAEKAALLGSTLPSFVLPNSEQNDVSSTELLAKGPLVVSFFRGAWCPYCMAELAALNAALPDIRAAGAELVVITPQLARKSAQMKMEKDLDLIVLTDSGLTYANTLGLDFTVPEDLVAIYKNFGLDIPATNGSQEWRLPIPARLVTNRDGIIVSRDVNPNYAIRPEPDATIETLRSM